MQNNTNNKSYFKTFYSIKAHNYYINASIILNNPLSKF